uniref:Elongin B n=1 Tax=Ursus americanus TaxID=9643 RepID=A0A452RUD0_URSAM
EGAGLRAHAGPPPPGRVPHDSAPQDHHLHGRKESSTVFELKRIVEGILKRPPDEQRLYKDDQLLDDGKTLGECGFTSQTARPQAPATVGLAFRAGERGSRAGRKQPRKGVTAEPLLFLPASGVVSS